MIVGAVLLERCAEASAAASRTIRELGPAAQAPSNVGGNHLGLVLDCAGDCNGDGKVAINELVTAVGIGLDSLPLSACPAADVSGNGIVEVNELVAAVGAALNGCPVAAPTATPTLPTEPTATPTAPTPTPGVGCALSFQDDSVDLHLLCVYAGSWNASCGTDTLQVGIQSDGMTFVAVLGTNPQIGILGNVDLPRMAALAAWYYLTDPSDVMLLSGTATLSADGSALEIALDSTPVPFSIDDSDGHRCDFIDYQGRFVGNIQGSSAEESAAKMPMPLMARELVRP